MVPTDQLELIELSGRHVPGALHLSEEAKWNQVKADWRMMLKAGTVFGFEAEGRLIASALTLPFGDRFGWVSMVLVTAKWQKQGLATRLLKACIERLESNGLVPVLDATPDGENVYRPLGFVPHFGLQRWFHEAPEEINLAKTELEAPEAIKVHRIDQEVFGGERPAVLESLLGRSVEFACYSPDGNGFLLGRDGRVATQIGPIYARDDQAALAMLDHALARVKGRIYIDACDHQSVFIEKLQGYGFKSQRPFLRMAKNNGEIFGDKDQMYAMAGPELG